MAPSHVAVASSRNQRRSLRTGLVSQFGHPRGIAGRLAGWVMAHRPSNRRRHAWTVDLLDLQPGRKRLSRWRTCSYLNAAASIRSDPQQITSCVLLAPETSPHVKTSHPAKSETKERIMRTSHQPSTREEAVTGRVIEIELLALDLTSCTRCVGTLPNIQRAIDTVRPVLEMTGAQVHISTLVIESEEQARQHRFVTSPTVRIDGRDIDFGALESPCDSCTELCGCDEGTSCRVWRYQGEDYTEAPVGLVVESMLSELFHRGNTSGSDASVYPGVPENLQRFFKSRSPARSCCSPTEQETCCDSSHKAECCNDPEPEICGCH